MPSNRSRPRSSRWRSIRPEHGLRFAELAATVVVGVVVGLMSLVYYDRWMANRRTRTPAAKFGPGAAAAAELTTTAPSDRWTPPAAWH